MTVPGVDATTWQYNGRGGVLQETRAIAGTGSFTTAYVAGATYDAAGRLTQLQLQGGALQTSYGYYPWPDAPNGGRLQAIRSGPPATPTALQDLAYTYDLAGNVASITDAGAATTYGYDALARLTTVNGQARYSYDPTGNLTSKVEPDLGWDLTLTYIDPAHVHALAVVSDPALAFSYTLAYDNNGNLTSASRLPFAQPTCQDADLLQWDSENRLAQREIRRFVFDFPRCEPYPKGCLIRLETYAHDGDGRMVKRTDEQGEHLYIGSHYELHAGAATSYYHFGGQRIAMRAGAGPASYLFADHLGSTRAVIAADGASGQRYTPWGEIAEGRNNTLPTEYTYTGQREASATGGIRLLDYGARSYWPFAGRFISPDSIVPSPGDPQSLNRYAYARNNALRYTDPTGMFEIDQLIEWFGENWRDQFTSAWQAILEEAELGDVLTSGANDITMFVLNEVGGLAGWHIPTEGLSNAVGIGDWAGTTEASSAALYRSVYAGSGRTHDISETQGWLEFQHGNNPYQRVGGRYSAAPTLSLPSEWYRGQSQHVQLYTYFAGLDVGLGDIAELGLDAIAVGVATWGARQAGVKAIATMGLAAAGGVAGVAVLAVNLAEWATFDTSYGIASGQGTPLPRPVPEPYREAR